MQIDHFPEGRQPLWTSAFSTGPLALGLPSPGLPASWASRRALCRPGPGPCASWQKLRGFWKTGESYKYPTAWENIFLGGWASWSEKFRYGLWNIFAGTHEGAYVGNRRFREHRWAVFQYMTASHVEGQGWHWPGAAKGRARVNKWKLLPRSLRVKSSILLIVVRFPQVSIDMLHTLFVHFIIIQLYFSKVEKSVSLSVWQLGLQWIPCHLLSVWSSTDFFNL